MEITLTVLALLVWAGVMTALWMDARNDARAAKHVLRIFVENQEARDQMVDAFEKFKRKAGAK